MGVHDDLIDMQRQQHNENTQFDSSISMSPALNHKLVRSGNCTLCIFTRDKRRSQQTAGKASFDASLEACSLLNTESTQRAESYD